MRVAHLLDVGLRAERARSEVISERVLVGECVAVAATTYTASLHSSWDSVLTHHLDRKNVVQANEQPGIFDEVLALSARYSDPKWALHEAGINRLKSVMIAEAASERVARGRRLDPPARLAGSRLDMRRISRETNVT